MPVVSIRAALPLAVAALHLTIPAVAVSADAPAKAGNVLSLGGKGKPTGKLLTRNELRECLAQEVRIRALNNEAAALQQGLDNDKAEIGQRAEALKQSIETLDRTSKEAVDAYNAKAVEREQLIDTYNAKLPAFNSKADALHAEQQSFASNCADRPYDEGDFFAIKRGK